MQHQGPPDQSEVLCNHPGNPFPKRDGPWETAGGKEYYSGPQPGLGLYSPLRGFLFYTSEVIYHKSITIVIRTPGIWIFGLLRSAAGIGSLVSGIQLTSYGL